ncbi:MAG: chemotaxis protein [Lachnospiraceae bacterium]|nr:chemotaxis protein [Lachnospiraceae bacterium]
MPRGNPTKQTIATEKYGKKAGWVSKSYKLKKALVEEFAEACQSAGVSQAAKLSEFMREFIDSQK